MNGKRCGAKWIALYFVQYINRIASLQAVFQGFV
jgi:hypothetical protein